MLESLLPAFSSYVPDVLEGHAEMVARALLCLPFATALGAALAFRPRRRGTPPRSAPVIQTQIILAIIGALIMLIVGSSVARAFGVAGAASMIRYRAEVADPKDAVVMLTCLSLGLATGVELFGLALFAAIFILAVLGAIESMEPVAQKIFELTVGDVEPELLRPALEDVLRRHGVRFELRSSAAKELVYETTITQEVHIEDVSDAILEITGGEEQAVRWEEPKKKK